MDADVLVATPEGHQSAVRFATHGDDIFVHSAFPTVDVDAVFFANTTGDLGIPDMQAFLDWLAAGT